MAEDEQKVSEEEVMEVEAEADQYGAAVVAEGEEEIDPNEGKKEWEKVVSIEDLGTAAMDDVGTPLLQAAREHNIERVKRLVLQGDEINAQHQGGDLVCNRVLPRCFPVGRQWLTSLEQQLRRHFL